MVKNFEDMFSGVDRIPACDRQTDGQTDGQTICDGIVRTMYTCRAVKIIRKRGQRQSHVGVRALGQQQIDVSICNYPAGNLVVKSQTPQQIAVTYCQARSYLPAAEHHHPLATTKLYLSVTEAHVYVFMNSLHSIVTCLPLQLYLVSFSRYSEILVENREFFIAHLHSMSRQKGRGREPRRNTAITFGTENQNGGATRR